MSAIYSIVSSQAQDRPRRSDMTAVITVLGRMSREKPANADLSKNKGSRCVLWHCSEQEVLRLHLVLPASRYGICCLHGRFRHCARVDT